MKKPKKNDILVAKALRAYAKYVIQNKDVITKEEAQDLDRALRSCPAISDIDRVWIRWRYVGESRGWITDDELCSNPKTWLLEYPKKIYEDAEKD